MSSSPFARTLRRDQTPAERRFWVLLHPFREAGHHLRRQAPMGPYVVEFVCKRHRLVFEIDGDSHYLEGADSGDATRTAYLETRGYSVIRFTNLDVMDNPDGVYSELMRLLGDPNTPTQPPPDRGRSTSRD